MTRIQIKCLETIRWRKKKSDKITGDEQNTSLLEVLFKHEKITIKLPTQLNFGQETEKTQDSKHDHREILINTK